MTDSVPETPDQQQQPVDQQAAEGKLAQALRRARWTILWERLWPAVASLATAVGLFLALSWEEDRSVSQLARQQTFQRVPP